MKMKLQLEFNEKFHKATDEFTVKGVGIFITPPLNEDYWIFRVRLLEDQAVLGFSKFTTIGIGFAEEEDWNTNLPYTCDAVRIYNHIKHNKKYQHITKAHVISAIELVQKASKEFQKQKSELN